MRQLGDKSENIDAFNQNKLYALCVYMLQWTDQLWSTAFKEELL